MSDNDNDNEDDDDDCEGNRWEKVVQRYDVKQLEAKYKKRNKLWNSSV